MKNDKVKIRPARFKEVIGTGGIGAVFASFNQLKDSLGEPHDCTVEGEWESRDNKVRVEWAFVINNDKRLVFTIYDYKNKVPLSEINQWNLGGRKKNNRILEYLRSKNIYTKFC